MPLTVCCYHATGNKPIAEPQPRLLCDPEIQCLLLNGSLCAAIAFQFSAGDDQLQAQIWSDHALSALFFCLQHDPAVRARRCASELLAMVALPSKSTTVQQLVGTLADKARDKDPMVQVRAGNTLAGASAVPLHFRRHLKQYSGHSFHLLSSLLSRMSATMSKASHPEWGIFCATCFNLAGAS